jgi:hypothetical protein
MFRRIESYSPSTQMKLVGMRDRNVAHKINLIQADRADEIPFGIEPTKTHVLNPTEIKNGFQPVPWELSPSKLLFHLRKAFLKKIKITEEGMEVVENIRIHEERRK